MGESEILNLPDVTLVIIETREHELMRLAAIDTLRAAQFGDVLIFCNRRTDGGFRFHQQFDDTQFEGHTARVFEVEDWPKKEGWSQHLWNEVPRYLRTTHMLSIQWDSWIVNPAAWTDDFLKFDYIGAPWWYKDGMNVGNGGFSLRSTALMKYVRKHREKYPCTNALDDDLLCRKYRPALQDVGFVWGTQAIADRFAFECLAPVGPTFGFHGIFNWPKVLDPEALKQRVAIAARSPYIRNNPVMWEQLVKVYPDARSFIED